MGKIEELTGTLEEIIYRNTENGYTVAVVEADDEYVTAVGTMATCNVGTRYTMTGSYREHHKYGFQFSIETCQEKEPIGKNEIIEFLSSGVIASVGPKLALTLYDHFGDETLEVIAENDDRLLSVPGIGKAKREKIVASYQAHYKLNGIIRHLQSHGLKPQETVSLYNKIGERLLEVIDENPYAIIGVVRGWGFNQADKLALSLGFEPTHPERMMAAVKSVLNLAAYEGNTFLPKKILIEQVSETLEVEESAVLEAINALGYKGQIKVVPSSPTSVEKVYLWSYYHAENSIASKIWRMSQVEPQELSYEVDLLIDQFQRDVSLTLSKEQRHAIKMATTKPISVITGGPGTGKTTIINGIIRVLEENQFSVGLCAPTGRAAKRMAETSGKTAFTIHRILEYAPYESSDTYGFGRDMENPLEYDAIIVDEMSMVDLMLMNALIQAVPTNCKLILVGDKDQLPPVGVGNVLGDIIESQLVDIASLQAVYRQGQDSMIAINAHAVNNGQMPSLNIKNSDFFFMERPTETLTAQLISQLVSNRLPAYYDDLDSIGDIQVLSPAKKGTLGTNNLNKILQEVLNPPDKEKIQRVLGSKLFRVGDKVMQTKNNYELPWRKADDMEEGSGIFNGDLGFIKDIDNGNNTMLILFDDDKLVTYKMEDYEDLDLAYAMTVHKSQGGEFPVIIMPVWYFPPMLSTRNLLYTAITRGKKLVVLVGIQRQLAAMIENNSIKRRFSGLSEILISLKEKFEGVSLKLDYDDGEYDAGNYDHGDNDNWFDEVEEEEPTTDV